MNTFMNLRGGDRVQFWYPGRVKYNKKIATVIPMLTFEDHVQVKFGKFGYMVNSENFIKQVKRIRP